MHYAWIYRVCLPFKIFRTWQCSKAQGLFCFSQTIFNQDRSSLVPRHSLLSRCPRVVGERTGDGDVTAHHRVQDWPSLVTRLGQEPFFLLTLLVLGWSTLVLKRLHIQKKMLNEKFSPRALFSNIAIFRIFPRELQSRSRLINADIQIYVPKEVINLFRDIGYTNSKFSIHHRIFARMTTKTTIKTTI